MARKLLISLAGALLAAAIAASPAAATSCDDLDDVLAASQAGDTITMDAASLCDDQTYQLPSHTITLEGNGAIFDGGDEGRMLEGNSVGATTIRNATFRNGRAGFEGGGAIFLTGSSNPVISGAVFEGNEADGPGGALYVNNFEFPGNTVNGTNSVSSDAFSIVDSHFVGNRAGDEGGAVYAEVIAQMRIEGSEFDGNHGIGNGGGVAAFFCNGADIIDNVFVDNVVDGDVPSRLGTNGEVSRGTALGGGLWLNGGFCQVGRTNGDGVPPLRQEGNLFESNTANGSRGDGGGEWVRTDEIVSTDDVFHANEITGEGFGGGLDAEVDRLTALNVVATANSIDGGAGGGINVAADRGTSVLEIVHGTIAGNDVGEGSGPGLFGNPNDQLILHNSIVHDNTSGTDIEGFDGDFKPRTNGAVGSRDVQYTLACEDDEPLPGEGNICADPELADVDAGDVHQTAASPTLEKGSFGLSSFLAADYEGDDRRIDSDRLGVPEPDMGADEALAPTTPTPTPVTPTPAAPAPTGGVAGTQSKSCVSRRTFRIKLRNRGQKVVKATVIVNGKRVKVLRGNRLTSRINLKGLPKGRFSVRITLKLANGKTISGVRRYRTCVPPRPGGVPRV